MTWEQVVAWLRAQPDQQELVRACFFDDPLLEAARRFYASGEWQATRALMLRPPGRALDIGAGRGISTYALAADGWQTSALEPDHSDLVGAGAVRALLAQAQLAAEIISDWGENLPFADATFETVLCRQVLHHARDLAALCRQIARVLKPGGVLVASREHVISHREDLETFLAGHPLQRFYGGENAFLLSEYHEAIVGAGLHLRLSLNPLQSEINLFPMSLEDHRILLARRLHIPRSMVSRWLMEKLGARSDTPGRLYTFVAEKR
jgi:SAM-dependent methyltransferase